MLEKALAGFEKSRAHLYPPSVLLQISLNVPISFRLFCETAVVSYVFLRNFAREIVCGRSELIPSRMPDV